MADNLEHSNLAYSELMTEMGKQNFDSIRFASYRTACKIRFIQKQTNFNLVDIGNAIEAIRQANLSSNSITCSALEQVLMFIFEQLNKRLPPSQHVDVVASTRCLHGFLVHAYDSSDSKQVEVFSIKVALCALSSGKLQDKLRYLFSLVSDMKTGCLIPLMFRRLLKDLLQLACSVQEQQFYQLNDKLISSVFGQRVISSVTLSEFTQMCDASIGPPPFLSWFVIIHKMAQVQFTVHQTSCSCCGKSNFVGFRYKCQICFNYNLCELCFWQGLATGTHNAETHSCKEYLHWKSAAKQLSDSLRRSFRLKSSSNSKARVELQEEPVTPAQTFIKNSPQHFATNGSNHLNISSNQGQTSSPQISRRFFNPPTSANLQSSPVLPSHSQPKQQVSAANSFSPSRVSVTKDPTTINRYGEPTNFLAPNSTLLNEYQRFGPSYAADFYEGNPSIHSPTAYGFCESPLDEFYSIGEFTMMPYSLDEEHRLIARYAANLASSGSSTNLHNISESNSAQNFTATNSCCSNLAALNGMEVEHALDALNAEPTAAQQERLINELEAKNREIMREIVRLREFSPSSDYNSLTNGFNANCYSSLGHSSDSSCSAHSQQEILEELIVLRDRKDELESHLENLQESRHELKNQLEHLIRLSKNYGNLISSPASGSSSLSQASGKRMQQLLSDKRRQADQEDALTDAVNKLVSSLHSDDDESTMKQIRLARSIENKLKLNLPPEIKRESSTTYTNSRDVYPSLDNSLRSDTLESKRVNETNESLKRTLVKENGLSSSQNKSINSKDSYPRLIGNLALTNNEKSNNSQLDNEKIDYNNILNRNIDAILNNNRSSAQQIPRRPNKYMSKYGVRQSEVKKNEENGKSNQLLPSSTISKSLNDEYTGSKLLSKALEWTETDNKSPCKVQTQMGSDKKSTTSDINRSEMFNFNDKHSKALADNNTSLPKQSSLDGCDANSSDNNSISTSSSVVTRCEVKSQPPMCFSSIAYVNANRAMQMQLQREQMLQMQQKISNGFGRQLPALPLTGPQASVSLMLSTTNEEVENNFDEEIDPDVVEADLEKRIGFYPVTNLSDTTADDIYAAAAAEDEEWLEAQSRPNYAYSLGY